MTLAELEGIVTRYMDSYAAMPSTSMLLLE